MYSATLILFRKAEDWNVGESDPKGKDSTINVKTTTEEEKTEKKAEARIRKYRDLKQYYIGSFNVRLDGLEMRFLEKLKSYREKTGRPKGFQRDAKIVWLKKFGF